MLCSVPTASSFWRWRLSSFSFRPALMLSARVTASSASSALRAASSFWLASAVLAARRPSVWRAFSARRSAAAAAAVSAAARRTLAAVAVSCKRAMAAFTMSCRWPPARAFCSKSSSSLRRDDSSSSSAASVCCKSPMAARWLSASASMLWRLCPARFSSVAASSMRWRAWSLSLFSTAIWLDTCASASVMARIRPLASSTASISCWASVRSASLLASNSSS